MITKLLSIAFILCLFGCAEPPSAPGSDVLVGDINGDGLSFTVADAVLFDQLLLSEALVQSDSLERVYLASDINGDGAPFTLADFFSMWRTVWGDAPPSNAPSDTVDVTYSDSHGIFSIDNAYLGSMRIVCRNDRAPELLADNTQLRYTPEGDLWVALVVAEQGADIDGDILSNCGEILSIELCTYDCQPSRPVLSPPLQQFYLEQAYPNPFTRDTEITFGLATAADWSLEIINVMGVTVGSYDGHAEAGTITITWPGGAYPAGVYFYRLTVGEQSVVKKLLLM